MSTVDYSRWSLTAKNLAIIFIKNGVNALIVNVGAWMILPANFNFHNSAAIWNIAKLAGVTILSREAAVFVPKLLKWSQTNADGTSACVEVTASQATSKSKD
jgi:hypothetical protein